MTLAKTDILEPFRAYKLDGQVLEELFDDANKWRSIALCDGHVQYHDVSVPYQSVLDAALESRRMSRWSLCAGHSSTKAKMDQKATKQSIESRSQL